MTYAPQNKDNSNQQHQQQTTKATAQTFSDNRESTAVSSPLQAMMANSPQQQKLKSAAQLAVSSPAQQKLNSTLQNFANKSEPVQRVEGEEPLQGKFESEPAQLEAAPEAPCPNNTGLPDNLKTGIENLSGMSMDHVRVHYNSDKPAQLQAHAYAQGSEIHVAPGQEQHLPHEAWHVVQQAQGRVKPTMQMKVGIQVNGNAGLEAEADLMGARANHLSNAKNSSVLENAHVESVANAQLPLQLMTAINHESTTFNAEGRGMGNFTVATGMQAVLDPNDPVTGSAASSTATPNLDAICKLFPHPLQQTHLLNADLGGFGVYENLYPMTAKANRDHYNNIEIPVKNSLHKARNNLRSMRTPQNEGNGIYYEISVAGDPSFSGLKNGAQFICEAFYIDNVGDNPRANIRKPIVTNTITSKPDTDGDVVGWSGYGQVLDTWDHKQGEPNPTASEGQKPYISKREGKADLNTPFSKYSEGKTWDDYKQKEKIFVNNHYSFSSQVKPEELKLKKLLDQTMDLLSHNNVPDNIENRQQAHVFLQRCNNNPSAAASAMFQHIKEQGLLNETMEFLGGIYSISDTPLHRLQAGIFLRSNNYAPDRAAYEMWKHLLREKLVDMCNEMVQEKGLIMNDAIGTKIAGVCNQYMKLHANPFSFVRHDIEKYLVLLLAGQRIQAKYHSGHIDRDQMQTFLGGEYDREFGSRSDEELLIYLVASAETKFHLQFK